MSISSSKRIYGFDVIRTLAMWLGIVLHSIIAYKIVPEAGWPFDYQYGSIFFDWLYDFIHSFRMPLFFLVSGFFCRLVIIRSGLKYFLKQRYKRIFIPFVLGVLFIVPLTLLPFNYFRFYILQHESMNVAVKNSVVKMFHWGGIAHLWFLYYLLLFYIAITIYFIILKKLNFEKKYLKKFGIFRFCCLSFFLLFFILFIFKAEIPVVSTGLKPNLFHFIYYGFFFSLGFFIHFNFQILNKISVLWLFFILVGILLNLILFKIELQNNFLAIIFLTAIETICLIFGFIGFFVKFCNKENLIWQYLSDSSYWVYLIHMGLVAFFQVLFIDSFIPPFLRPFTVLIFTLCLSLISYHYLVRYTAIGDLLHGSRRK